MKCLNCAGVHVDQRAAVRHTLAVNQRLTLHFFYVWHITDTKLNEDVWLVTKAMPIVSFQNV